MATDEKKEAMREAVFADSFQYATKPRFGCFSLPVSTALGDTNKFPVKTANKDPENGDVITGPRNFYTTKNKVGKMDKVLFSRPTYISTGDPFKNAALQTMRTSKKDGHKDAGHDLPFKPAKVIKEQIHASYKYMEQKPNDKKNYRDEEGAVILGPRNFVTNPQKKGKVYKGTTFGGKIPYMEDDYDMKKKIAAKELDYHHSKVQEQPFSNMPRHTETFNKNIHVYGSDVPLPPEKKKDEPAPATEDERPPFKPTHPGVRGLHKTFEKFPLHMPNPPKQLKRVIKEENAEEPPAFKIPKKHMSGPQASVATNFRNLKSSFPSAFRR